MLGISIGEGKNRGLAAVVQRHAQRLGEPTAEPDHRAHVATLHLRAHVAAVREPKGGDLTAAHAIVRDECGASMIGG